MPVMPFVFVTFYHGNGRSQPLIKEKQSKEQAFKYQSIYNVEHSPFILRG